MATIILASQSPRRKQLLEWADIPFEVMVSDTDESFPLDMAKEFVPEFIAKNKALAIETTLLAQNRYNPTHCIIAADTIVVLDDTILGKPADAAEAIDFISKLSGHTHQVITGVVVCFQGKLHSFHKITHVTFNTLTLDQITYYVNKYQPFDKAGAYAIQEWIGVIGIASIEGDFYNVMGLPVNKLVQLLKEIKAM